jgi:hypothetical protein
VEAAALLKGGGDVVLVVAAIIYVGNLQRQGMRNDRL